MMGFADTAMYACVMAAMGWGVIPVMVAYSITFLRPAQDTDLVAQARIVRRGGRLHYLECWLTSDGDCRALRAYHFDLPGGAAGRMKSGTNAASKVIMPRT